VTTAVVSRRAALGRLLGWPAAVAALGTAATAGVVQACRRVRRAAGVPVAPLASVPPGSAFRARIGEDPIIVVNVGGEIRAFAAVCTHEGCPLGWNPDQHLIRCPCHGGAYDTSGRVVDGPPPRPLSRLDAEVDGGTVFVSPPPSTPPSAAPR
jgi:cytochrome b6-f complex iron-sulfur subunit